MITFLASPKPFRDHTAEQQYRAIRSWFACDPDAEVILYGDSAGIRQAGKDLNAKVVSDIACTEKGIPYFGAIAEHAAAHGRHDLQVYLNCDILLSGIVRAMKSVALPQFLLVGQRINLAESVYVDLCADGWLETLRSLASDSKAQLYSVSAIDYFGFRRGIWTGLPRVVIGRAGYDGALLAHCFRNRIPVINATRQVVALHQFHDYSHAGGHSVVWFGEDAMTNFEAAGGRHSQPTIADADYILDGDQLIKPSRPDRLRRAELHLRYHRGLPRLSLAIRAVWRVRRALGLHKDEPMALEQLLSSYEAA